MTYNTSKKIGLLDKLKSSPKFLAYLYIYVSAVGLLYTILHTSGTKISLFKYYELTDYLLIGILNFKVFFCSLSIMLMLYILISESEIYFIQKYRKVGYGENLDPDSMKYMLKQTLKSIWSKLFFLSPVFVLLIFSFFKFRSDSPIVFILLSILGLLYYFIVLLINKIRTRPSFVANEPKTLIISIVIIVGLLTSMSIGFIDRNMPNKYDCVLIKTQHQTLKGELLGASNKYVFLSDSTTHVINKNLIEAIDYLSADSCNKRFLSIPKSDSCKSDTLNKRIVQDSINIAK